MEHKSLNVWGGCLAKTFGLDYSISLIAPATSNCMGTTILFFWPVYGQGYLYLEEVNMNSTKLLLSPELYRESAVYLYTP